ncbi:MAG TPA: amidohydrolase family protein [Ktedonobacteraceae bacterium]|nr:amidohydrolase family protein [Ktedonobacteraceae bacterium]
MDVKNLVAIDVHTHAEVSSRVPDDPLWKAMQEASADYFKDEGPRPTIDEVAAYYRARRIAAVIFPVDMESTTGIPRVSNEEVAETAAQHADVLIPFASIDPAKGKMGAREARRLIEHFGVRGFKFHPPMQAFYPNDRSAYGLYEVIQEAGLPALFHTGHSGIGSGMRGGGGVRLKYSNPMYLDDVAVDFPDMPIIMAHPSFPWQDEALSVCLHKPQVYIDLSGWSPKYFPPQLIQYANTLLKHKMLFGSDYPLITPDRWMADFEQIAIRPEARPLILKENAVKLLKLG